MISSKTFRQMALALPDVTELPHFEKASFRIGKSIFATLHEDKDLGMVALTPEEQYVYMKFDPASFVACPGAWGRKGYTWINLKKVKRDVAKEAMDAAYNHLANKKDTKNKKQANKRGRPSGLPHSK